MKSCDIKELCSGCSACYSICPAEAITMREDEEGFLFPYIDEGMCIACGKCKQVCPMNEAKCETENVISCHAVKTTDDILMESSSGGMFTLLANKVLEHNGYVCGAAMQKDCMGAEHIIISDKSELWKLQRSKYVQSDLKDCFRRIKALLDDNKEVMFVGCPCQVEGLKKYLKHDYAKLLLVDLICHGVPSPKVWRYYLNEIAAGEEIKEVKFRDKSIEIGSCISVTFENGRVMKQAGNKSLYIKGFLTDIYNRRSCGECPFPYVKRPGDITLGDLWGVEEIYPEFDDGKGTSLVLVNTDKGRYIYESVTEYAEVRSASLDYQKVRMKNKPLYKHNYIHPGRENFFAGINASYTFETAYQTAYNTPYDIGIIGLWYCMNYGAVLTSYALYKVVEKMGYKAVMLDIPPTYCPDEPQYRDALEDGRRFIERYCQVSERYYLPSENSQLNKLCNTFLTGSDQLWKGYNGKFRWSGGFNFLDFADDSKRKVAYATSFGEEVYTGDRLDEMQVECLLKCFDAISVREDSGVRICEGFGVDAVTMPDPVFLCDTEVYDNVTSKEDLEREPYIFAYILQPTVYKQNLIKEIAKHFRLKVVAVADKNPNYIAHQGVSEWTLDVIGNVKIDEWLWYIKNAEYVLTDSYHGFCFSLIYQKEFLCLSPRDSLTRFESLAEKTELLERINYSQNSEKALLLLEHPLNYMKIQKILEDEKDKAVVWLKNTLTNSREDKKMMNLTMEKYRVDYIVSYMYKKLYNIMNRQKKSLWDGIKNLWTAINNSRTQIVSNRERIVNNRKLLIHLYLKDRLKNKSIAIKGAGTHTTEILKLLDNEVDVKCIVVDKITDKHIFPYPVITMNQLQDYQVDLVLISSYRYAKEMKEELRSMDSTYEIFDLYEELALMGIVLEKEFYY